MMKYKYIWTKFNEHGMIIIDQNVNIKLMNKDEK